MGAHSENRIDNADGTYPCFINSLPLGEDMLEGQAQEQIAESVANLIRNDITENRLIGLDGAWGSGKSNLIKIIESKLGDTHHVYCHDAWGHQEDLHRRAFLEELTADLCSSGILDPREWGQKLKDLLSRKRETRTKTIPHLSHGVLVTVLVTVLTPIAGTIAGGVTNLCLRFVVAVLPLLCGVIWWLAASFKAGHPLGLNEIYSLYKDRELETETYTTISEKEPSVSEFRRWIGDLSKSLKGKKLIVVFDNMDRLPPDRVRELWGSIHTFFAEDIFDAIWVMVPFDRKHISAAFEDKEEISDQFLSKTFSVIFRVPHPVLTDWQRFFEAKFREAFGESQDREILFTRRVFDQLQVDITPRSIIAFINELVSLHLVVAGEVRLRYIAVFILAKKDILENPVDQILSRDFLKGAAPIFREDLDLPNSIAALVYHVPIASASQVSLTREIQNALRDTNISRFNELAKHLHFMDILEQVFSDSDLDITSSAETLGSLEPEFVTKDEIRTRITRIWDNICGQYIRTPVTDQKFTITHEVLLKHSSSSKQQALVAHLVEGVRNAEGFSGDAYYVALSELSDYIADNKIDVNVLSLVTEIKKPPEVFIDYVGAAKEDYKLFKLKCDGAALQQHVVSKVPGELDGLAVLSAIKDEYDLGQVLKRLEKEAPGTSIDVGSVEHFYALYKAIFKKWPITPLEDSHINNLLPHAIEGSEVYFELFAMRLARANSFPDFGGTTQTILTVTDEEFAARIAERIEYYTSYGGLLMVYVSWKQPLLKTVLRNLTLKRYGESRMEVLEVLGNFKELYSSLEVAPEDFIGRLNSWSSFAKEKVTKENVFDIVKDPEFFEYATEVMDELSRHCIERMIEYLDSLDIETWGEALRDENSYLFDVAYWLLKGGQMKELPDNAITVYKEILKEAATGEFEMGEEAGWEVYYERTNKNRLKPTFKTIRDKLILNMSVTPGIFIEFHDKLLAHGSLREKGADVARTILALVANDEACLSIIIDHAEFYGPLVRDAGDDADDFKDQVRQKVSADPSSKGLVAFAKEIGLD